MTGEEGCEVVGHNRVHVYVGVETALSRTRLQDIPECGPGSGERRRAIRVGTLGVEAENLTNDSPEGVPWMRVVLLFTQGDLTGHRAKDENV